MKTTRRHRGFTLIELLTVIAIIGILAAILIPTVGKVRGLAKKSKCLSNVRQITVALINLGNSNKNQTFPANNANGGRWAWDVSHKVAKDLIGLSGSEVLICPSSTMLDYNTADELYNFKRSSSPQTLDGYAVSGYVLLIPGTGVGTGTGAETEIGQIPNQYLNRRIQSLYSVSLGGQTLSFSPSQRPLVVDAVISASSSLTSFANVPGGLTNNVSNHMSGSMPQGAHTGYVDGHVKWRAFKNATTADEIRDADYFSLKSTGASPRFWF